MLTAEWYVDAHNSRICYEPTERLCYNGRASLIVRRWFRPNGDNAWHSDGRVVAHKYATRSEVEAAFVPAYDE